MQRSPSACSIDKVAFLQTSIVHGFVGSTVPIRDRHRRLHRLSSPSTPKPDFQLPYPGPFDAQYGRGCARLTGSLVKTISRNTLY